MSIYRDKLQAELDQLVAREDSIQRHSDGYGYQRGNYACNIKNYNFADIDQSIEKLNCDTDISDQIKKYIRDDQLLDYLSQELEDYIYCIKNGDLSEWIESGDNVEKWRSFLADISDIYQEGRSGGWLTFAYSFSYEPDAIQSDMDSCATDQELKTDDMSDQIKTLKSELDMIEQFMDYTEKYAKEIELQEWLDEEVAYAYDQIIEESQNITASELHK